MQSDFCIFSVFWQFIINIIFLTRHGMSSAGTRNGTKTKNFIGDALKPKIFLFSLASTWKNVRWSGREVMDVSCKDNDFCTSPRNTSKKHFCWTLEIFASEPNWWLSWILELLKDLLERSQTISSTCSHLKTLHAEIATSSGLGSTGSRARRGSSLITCPRPQRTQTVKSPCFGQTCATERSQLRFHGI